MATNHGDAGGPSLLQARHNHHHDHHNVNHNHHRHLHLQQHRRLHRAEADTTSPHIRSPPNEKLHGRQVVVVETVSVVHYIDGAGAVTSVATLSTDPVAPTTAFLLPPAVPAGLSSVVEALPSVSLSGLIPDLTDGAPSSTSSADPETSSSSLSASPETLTSAPSDSSSAFPTLSGVFNSSSTYVPSSSLFSNHSIPLFSNSSRTASSTRSTSTSASTSTTTASTTTSSPLWTSTTTNQNIHTLAAGGGRTGADAGAGVAAPGPVPDSAGPAPETPSGLAPETRNAVVGGVVGSVAGIALVAAVLLYLFKWRRQRGQGIMLLGDGDSTTRGRAFSSPGPAGPSSGGGAMTQRSGPFAIPSALAKLSSKRAIDAPPAGSPTQERGFQRVSGKKLVSVLESGGDGYTDPHDSIGSGSSYYRDSQAFSENSGSSPLQLGSPMRPVSGVPIYHDGPQRMPSRADGPLPAAGARRSVFPTTLPLPDAVGRSFASRDGSRGSGSRFTEEA